MRTLAEVLRDGPLGGPGDVARIAALLAEQVRFGHDQGAVHGDLGPETVRVESRGADWAVHLDQPRAHGPAEMADRWLQTAAGFVTYGIFAAALVFIMAVTTLSALSNYGVSEGRAELIVMLLGSIIAAVACGYARVKLIEEPVRGRMVALGIAAAGVLMAVLGAVGTEAELGLDATQVLLIGLIAPAILTSLVLAPPSVRARYGLPWGEQNQLGT
ncbi:hypothetical protein ACQBAT_01150 [Ornithinimicrobium sp. Y1847]|uniref:DUF7937 domain-containing protein n=1 Tax=Ornithinimicrobium sp. Y1847 TaxID=3405419 RepID=UPI003B67EB5E